MRTQTRAHAHTLRTLRCPPVTPSTVSFLFAPVLFSLMAPKASGWCPDGIPLLRVPLVRCGPDGVLAASRLSLVVQMLSLSCPLLSLLSSVVPCGVLFVDGAVQVSCFKDDPCANSGLKLNLMVTCNPFGLLGAAPPLPFSRLPRLAPPPPTRLLFKLGGGVVW